MKTYRKNPEAEVGVLGTLVSIGEPENVIVQKAMLELREDYFSNIVTRELFNLIKKCFDAKQVFDELKMLDLTRTNIDLSVLFDKMVLGEYFSESRLEGEINELKTSYIIREMIFEIQNHCNRAIKEPITPIAYDIMSKGLQKAASCSMGKIDNGIDCLTLADKYLLGEFSDYEDVQTGLDNIGVLPNSSLITIAGWTGVGKTFFSLYLMDKIGHHQPDKQCLFFSLEMPAYQIWQRYLGIVSNKSFSYLKKNEKDMIDAISKAAILNPTIYDTARLDIEFIETRSRTKALEKPISVIVVDYVGLVQSSKKYDRHDLCISDITQRLVALSMELGCIVICLSQVNRDASQREDKCPYPWDVADSVGSVRSSSLWIGIARESENVLVAKARKTRGNHHFEAYFDFNGITYKPIDKPFMFNTEQLEHKDKFMKKYKQGDK